MEAGGGGIFLIDIESAIQIYISFGLIFGLDHPQDFIAKRDCYKQIEIRTNHKLHSLGFA